MQRLICVALMASHLMCVQMNYYKIVLPVVVNQFTNDLLAEVVAFDPPTYHDTTLVV